MSKGSPTSFLKLRSWVEERESNEYPMEGMVGRDSLLYIAFCSGCLGYNTCCPSWCVGQGGGGVGCRELGLFQRNCLRGRLWRDAYKSVENEACLVLIFIAQLISFPQIILDDVYSFCFNLACIFSAWVLGAF